MRVMDCPVGDACGVLIHIIIDTFPYRPGGGYHHKERRSPCRHALAHDIIEVSVLHPVQFVHNDKTCVQTVQRVRVPRQRLKFGERGRIIEVVFPFAEMLGECRRLLYHVVGFIEQKSRLRVFGRRAVNLRAAFSVACQHIEGKPCEERRLPVFAPYKEETFPVLSISCFPVNKAEQGFNVCF